MVLHLENQVVGEVLPQAADRADEILCARKFREAAVLAVEVAHGHSVLPLERPNELALGLRWRAGDNSEAILGRVEVDDLAPATEEELQALVVQDHDVESALRRGMLLHRGQPSRVAHLQHRVIGSKSSRKSITPRT